MVEVVWAQLAAQSKEIFYIGMLREKPAISMVSKEQFRGCQEFCNFQ